MADFELTQGRVASEAERTRLAATEARRGRRAVAGFDLVFTPVKSVSLLWALGDAEIQAQVEAAHHEALRSTLDWVEQHAAFTRTGHGGVAQVDTTGLLAVAFDHRESRSGDPDLHTHVAVANKVCGTDGKWRSLDARGLYALGSLPRSATTRGSRTPWHVDLVSSSRNDLVVSPGSDRSGRWWVSLRS